MRPESPGKPPLTHVSVVLAIAGCAAAGCQGEGTFFSAIVDGGPTMFDAARDGSGGSGGFGGSGGIFGVDAGADSGHHDDGGADDSGAESWISPFPNTGTVGWRNSRTALCGAVGPGQRAWDMDLWSDDQNVYAAVIGELDPTADSTEQPGRCAGQCTWLSLYRNDGQTWSRVLNQAVPAPSVFDWDMVPRLRGVSQGPLFLHRANVPTRDAWPCMLSTLVDGTTTCSASGAPVHALSVVNARRAFAVVEDTSLLTWNGSTWLTDPRRTSFAPQDLWANEADVIVLGPNTIGRLTDTGWDENELPFVGATAIWGRSAEDLWVGGIDGAVWHFDGQAWQQLGTLGDPSCGTTDAVRGIWGTADSVYAFGERTLLRWSGGSAESLANWSCATSGLALSLRSVWGNSDSEIFLGLRDTITSTACDSAIVMRFDGRQFHRM